MAREVGPHGHSEGGQVRGRSLRVSVGHPESPLGTRYHNGNHDDGLVFLVIGVPVIMGSLCRDCGDGITSTIAAIVVATGSSHV